MSDHSRQVVVIGEALIDVLHGSDGSVQEHPGGSPANVALTLGRLERKPQLVTSLAEDDRGRAVLAWLKNSGVDVAAAVPASGHTSTATARLDSTGSARYLFDIDWTIDTQLAEPASLLHVGSIAAYLEPGAAAVARMIRDRRAMSTITYDPNIRAVLIDDPAAVRAQVARIVAVADVVKASDEDIRWLYPHRDVTDVAREWHAGGVGIVVVTLGGKGAVAVADCGVIPIDSVAVEVVDTVGAGDTFMGALIDGLIEARLVGADRRDALQAITAQRLQAILRRSARAAAVTVSRRGMNPPSGVELADF